MALTRKMLKGMGLTEEQADTIIEAHSETVDGLKEKLKTAEEKASAADDLQKELNGLKAKNGEDYEAKWKAEKKAFDDFKAEITAKETKTAKEKAVRSYLEGKNITGDNLDIAMMAVSGMLDSIDLDGENIKNTKPLDNLYSDKLHILEVTQKERGAKAANPPANTGGGAPMTRAEVFATDDNGRFKLNATQRQDALAKIIQNEQKGV